MKNLQQNDHHKMYQYRVTNQNFNYSVIQVHVHRHTDNRRQNSVYRKLCYKFEPSYFQRMKSSPNSDNVSLGNKTRN